MYTTDTTKAKTCWRCRKCGFTTPLGEDTCSNPSCRADLSLYGEPFDPAIQPAPVREEPQPVPSPYDTKQPSSSNLWEESAAGKEPKRRAEVEYRPAPKVSGSAKRALKKQQQAEALAQQAAMRRSLHNRGPVKTFFLSVLVILVSHLVGVFCGGCMMMSFTEWGDLFYYEHSLDYGSYYIPASFPWHQIIPGVLLITLSAAFARFAVKEKADRKLMYTAIAFWTVPFGVACWRRFSHDGGDSYELLSVYLFFLFILEPILVGSAFAGVKGLRIASSILRWISILMLVVTGIIAVCLSVDTFFGGIL